MKYLITKIANYKFIVTLRNITNFFPKKIKECHAKNTSISDAFFWRTDNGFETIFKFSDLPNLFYNDNSKSVSIFIFSNKNILIKKIIIKNMKISNTLIINKKILNNLESFGVFYIYHKFDKKLKIAIRNSCYTGYSLNGNLPSFVHGNCPATMMNLKNHKIYRDFITRSFFCNQKYIIQNYFDDRTSKSELLINNPTNKKIKFFFEKKKYYLKTGNSLIINNNSKIAELVSNCYFIRPIIFTYKKNFIDVYHA
jgi:hypothetical protein